jgi:peptidoglycan-associated lipoprotein
MRKLLLAATLLVLTGCIAPSRQGKEVEGSAPIVDPPWSEDRICLAEQTVYFPLGVSELSAKAKVAVVACYMTTNPVVAVRIEGHGDDRGTEKRNYELGESRAEALREELVRLGVDSARLDTRACGKKVRRDPDLSPAPMKWHCADFVVLVPPP